MSEEFKILTDREHVLLRTNVYLGSVTEEPHSGIIDFKYQEKMVVPALIKMIEEIFQNSIDEHIRTNGEYAKNIGISFADTIEGTEITVADDGRGIPQDIVGGKPRPLLAWTELRAGSNFDDSNRVGAGANGMGASLTNTFSLSFIGTTCDGKNRMVVECSDNMQNIKHHVSKGSVRGTQVKFIPDLARFGLTYFTGEHMDVLRDRFQNLSILYPGIQFKFNNEKIHFKNLKTLAKNFHEDAISVGTDKVSLVFAPSGTDEEFRCLSYVNGIYIKNGGSHVDYMMGKVIENLRANISKKHKIDVLPNQIRQHLLFASWCTGFPALKFDSQSKERVTNSVSDVSAYLGDIDFDKISKQILGTPSIIDPIIQAILYKKEMAEKLALQKKIKGQSKMRVINHIAATDPDPEKRRLSIVEGLSALSPHLSVRNQKRDGAYAIKGKLLNVYGKKPIDIMKNKEITELMSIIGLEFGKKATDLNYGKIITFSDSDFDGSHVFGLLLNLFSNWPELFHEGRIYRCIAPLYYCTKGKESKSFYNKEEFDAFNSKGWDVQFFKGLGSMTKEIYKECLENPMLIKVSASDADFKHLSMFFGDDSQSRKDWMTAV